MAVDESAPANTPKLNSKICTEYMQATTFLVQVAQARALEEDFAVTIDAVVGHSFGEVVAATVAGVISMEVGVEMTLVRTQACMDIERNLDTEVMGMATFAGPCENDIRAAMAKFEGASKGIFFSGIISAREFLISGNKASIVEFSESNNWSPSFVESDIAFHSPYVTEVGNKVESLLQSMDRFDSSIFTLSKKLFMTSKGGLVAAQAVQTPQFWKDSVVDPILMDQMLSSLETVLGGKNIPIIDMSPRGLYVNWFRRNSACPAKFGGVNLQIVTAPTYSWDFVRVLQHYRNKIGPSHTQQQTMPFLPAYPFCTHNCTKIVKEALVRSRTETISTHVYTMCQDVVFETIANDDDCLEDFKVVGIDLVCRGCALWDVLDISSESIQNILEVESIWLRPTTVPRSKVTLIVMGPLKGYATSNASEAPMSAALDFVDVVGRLLVSEDSAVDSLLFVTEDETHAAFEYIVGFFAAMQFEVPHLRFVSTLRLVTTLSDSAIHTVDAGTAKKVLAMAAKGETVLRITVGESPYPCLAGQRIVPPTKSWTLKMDWVKSDCLYVVSGAAGTIAKSLLPFLAGHGVRHFLLLINRTRPDASMIEHMLSVLGANTVHIEYCIITEAASIQAAVRNGLRAAKVGRVAGVFHLASINIPLSTLPVPKIDLQKIMQVKFMGHETLLNTIKLRDGDIFSVPGSITSYIGGGIGYAATNSSCRALQLQAAKRGLLAPYPAVGISALSMQTNLMPDVQFIDREFVFKMKGVEPCASQLFNLGMTGIFCSGKDILLCRVDAERMHRFLNMRRPNLLCIRLLQIQQENRCMS